MDFLKSAVSQATTGQTTGNPNSSVGNDNQNMPDLSQQGQQQGQQQQQQGGGGGLFDQLKNAGNNMAGGGAQGEAKEDYLDKGVDMFQQKFMGAGDQSNESAAEQAKDEMISDQIRSGYKSATGKDFFIADK